MTLNPNFDTPSGHAHQPLDHSAHNPEQGLNGKLDYQSVYNQINQLRQDNMDNSKGGAAQLKSNADAANKQLHQDGILPNLHIQLDDKASGKSAADQGGSKRSGDVGGEVTADSANRPPQNPQSSLGSREVTADSAMRPPNAPGSDASFQPAADSGHHSGGHGGGGHPHHGRHHHRHHRHHRGHGGNAEAADNSDQQTADPSVGNGSGTTGDGQRKSGADAPTKPGDNGSAPKNSSLHGNNNTEKAMNYFMDKGLSREQAAGIVGNFAHEAPGVNPGQHQHGGGPGFGIGQWEGQRKDDLNKFAQEQGQRPDDLKTQLDFAWKEMNTDHKAALNAVRHTHSPGAAAIAFEKRFEAARKPHMAARVQQAMNAYNQSPQLPIVEIANGQ